MRAGVWVEARLPRTRVSRPLGSGSVALGCDQGVAGADASRAGPVRVGLWVVTIEAWVRA